MKVRILFWYQPILSLQQSSSLRKAPIYAFRELVQRLEPQYQVVHVLPVLDEDLESRDEVPARELQASHVSCGCGCGCDTQTRGRGRASDTVPTHRMRDTLIVYPVHMRKVPPGMDGQHTQNRQLSHVGDGPGRDLPRGARWRARDRKVVPTPPVGVSFPRRPASEERWHEG